jgi:putative adhesin
VIRVVRESSKKKFLVMVFNSKERHGRKMAAKTTILLMLSVVFFFALGVQAAFGQKKFSQRFPAGNNVRLQLINRSGTVTVEGWNRAEVSIAAYLEAPSATVVPQNIDGTIYLNLVRDNQARGDVGSVNFTIRVPFNAMVDIETKIGNLNVSNVRGGLVRAHVSSDGDITLTNISATKVSAENGIGNIFFDGEIVQNGNYRFASMRGDINLRVPFNSSFRLVATAPSTRSINLGSFSGGNLKYVGDGRRVIGQLGDGSATLTVTNQRGSIAFISR